MKSNPLTYLCTQCGKESLINCHEDECYSYCFKCNIRCNQVRKDGSKIKDFKSFKAEFDETIQEFRELTRLVKWQVNKIQHLEEFVLQANLLESKIDDLGRRFTHSLEEIDLSGVKK